MIEVDVCGLSCPEPVMLAMDAIEENPGEEIKIMADEAHTRTNIEKMLEHQGIEYATVEKGTRYEISFHA